MADTVISFSKLSQDLQPFAGGKGSMLAKMYQEGYPVPDGFVVLPCAFHGDKLKPEAWKDIQSHLDTIRKSSQEALVAVRSSALGEDSETASFAGEFETVLNVKTNDEILNAIYTVFNSKMSERVKAYSSVHGISEDHQIAVVIQLMVKSEMSGVLFTADPISGNHLYMVGNFVYGLGEQLVSGEANPYTFKMLRPGGRYEGSSEFKRYASKLYKYAKKLEDESGSPQDIEWSVSEGRLYILQARPVTTLKGCNRDTYEWNDSLTGDFLWSNTNVGEAIPDVITPLTWTVLKSFSKETDIIPGNYSLTGNICGRVYANIGLIASIYPAMGMNIKHAFKKFGDLIGQIPEGISIPVYPFSGMSLMLGIIPRMRNQLKNLKEASKNTQEYLDSSSDWCSQMTKKIYNVKIKDELISIWNLELKPRYSMAQWMMRGGANQFSGIAFKLNRKLIKLVGTSDANALLSNLRGDSELASLGPLIGLSKMIKGEMPREEYLSKYGHRGPHEMELSIPQYTEDTDLLDHQIEEFLKSNNDIESLLDKQHSEFEGAWKRFKDRYPKKIKSLEEQLKKVSKYAHVRESVRSEFVRLFRVIRAFALQSGKLTGIGSGVFFMYLDEVLSLLSGNGKSVDHISERQDTYNKYKDLPPYPSIILGRFDPFKWAKDPNRRSDYYNSHTSLAVQDSDTLKGFAGAAGQVEGIVRILNSPEDGDKLETGEILVTSTTNVGWTPLFPRSAAIITDVGAPLSHAAIVARELGIPAVVGCGNATTRLKTGCRVFVDGGQGTVQILDN